MPTVPSSDGVTVAVHDLGGDGPPLLLAHATGFHGLVWAPLAARLSGRFRCVSFDQRGHGDSAPPADGRFDWEGFADDVLAVVDHLGLDRPFAVGHSAGGAALLLAEEARPGTFAGIYCFEPIVVPSDTPAPAGDNPLSAGAERRREVFASRDEALANFASKPPFAALHPDVLRAYVQHGFAAEGDGAGEVRLKCRREHEAQTYRMGSAHSAYSRLHLVACPVVLAAGATTDAMSPATLEVLAARLPHARVDVLDGLGHFGPLEDPDRLAEAIAHAFARG